jgi:hypothetical protein
VPPAYTAPELIDSPIGGLGLQKAGGSGHTKEIDADYRTDVYGLGLLLYEMLVGEPAFAYEQMSDADVYRAVERGQRAPMNRVEDVERVAQVALRATSAEVAERQPFAVDMAKELVGLFGTAPEPKKRKLPAQETIMVFVIASLAIAFVVVLAMVLSGTGA